MDGLRWGMSHAEVTKTFTENGGVIWKDYDEKLAKARVGPEMTAIENEREQAKQAFGRSFIEFKDTPTGYDATGIKGEYTYRNRESLMWITRQGKKRYFFFINDRLWKIYDEVPLAESGALGKTYLDAVNTMNGKLGAQGRIQGADPAKGINATTVDWKDGSSHLRVVDRSGERVVAVVMEDNGTLGNLASLRPNKAEDPTAIDPTIAAVTKGGLSDPNAAKARGKLERARQEGAAAEEVAERLGEARRSPGRRVGTPDRQRARARSVDPAGAFGNVPAGRDLDVAFGAAPWTAGSSRRSRVIVAPGQPAQVPVRWR